MQAMMKALLEHSKININVRNDRGETALTLLIRWFYYSVAELLLNRQELKLPPKGKSVEKFWSELFGESENVPALDAAEQEKPQKPALRAMILERLRKAAIVQQKEEETAYPDLQLSL